MELLDRLRHRWKRINNLKGLILFCLAGLAAFLHDLEAILSLVHLGDWLHKFPEEHEKLMAFISNNVALTLGVVSVLWITYLLARPEHTPATRHAATGTNHSVSTETKPGSTTAAIPSDITLPAPAKRDLSHEQERISVIMRGLSATHRQLLKDLAEKGPQQVEAMDLSVTVVLRASKLIEVLGSGILGCDVIGLHPETKDAIVDYFAKEQKKS